jgi:cell division protein ZapA
LEPIVEKGICVRILDKDFRVACPEGHEQPLYSAAHYLDKQMRKIRQTGRVIGIERIAVMAALNISAELLNLKQEEPEVVEDFSGRLKLLQDKIDNAISSAPTRKDKSCKGIIQDEADKNNTSDSRKVEEVL